MGDTLNTIRQLFAIGRSAKPEPKPDPVEEARKVLRRYSPMFRQVEPDIWGISTSPIVDKLTDLGPNIPTLGYKPSGFAMPIMRGGGGFIHMEPNLLPEDYPELLAHEAGHILQGAVGKPLRNDKEANYILREARRNKMREKSMQPRPIDVRPKAAFKALLEQKGYVNNDEFPSPEDEELFWLLASRGYQPPDPISGDERGFRDWYSKFAKHLKLNPDPDDPRHFYDYRAAYKAGAVPDALGHWPSEYKREGHPNLIVNGIDTRTGKATKRKK